MVCTQPVVVFSFQSLAFPVVLGLDFLTLSELQMEVGQNLYWFRSNGREKYCFEKDTNNFEWTALLSLYSAIDPRRAAHPTLSRLDSELLHKAVKRAQLDGGSNSYSDVCTSSLGQTNGLTHKIFVTQDIPIKQKSYQTLIFGLGFTCDPHS